MFRKKLCIALFAFFLLLDTVQGKKTRRTRRPKPEEEDYTPQPSVVSYSTFGFNDVGTYEGFVPSSPDYAKLLSNGNEDSGTRPLSSGYLTSPDSNDYGSSVNAQPNSGQSFSMSEDGGLQTASFVQHPKNAVSVYNIQSFGPSGERNVASDEIYGRNVEEINAPSYGTKLNSRNRIRTGPYNNSDVSGPSGSQNDDKYSNYQEPKPVFENPSAKEVRPVFESRPASSESSNSFYNPPSYQSSNVGEYNKPVSSDAVHPVKYQRVVDFTKLKQYHPNELDTSKLPSATPIPNIYENESTQNILMNSFDVNSTGQNPFFTPATKIKDMHKPNYSHEDTFERNNFKVSNYKENPHETSGKDNLLISYSDPESKKKPNQKPWSSGTHVFKKWKEPTSSNGYEYSTNYSSMSFSYDSDKEKIKRPLGSSIEELIPASSNLDLSNYRFPDTDFSNFKKMPEYKLHEEDEYAHFPSFKEVLKPHEIDYDHFKHGFSTPPTTTANWGNAFKSSEYSISKQPSKYKYRDSEEIVNIPRRPNRVNYEKPYESKFNEWSQYNHRPYKSRPYKDWGADNPTTRFKTEEDLLGLRNQDTSRPTYLPSYQSTNFLSEDVDYKRLVEKWRQAYLKSKLKDSLRDYEGYGTETKAKHVPVPKPYPIEVPHPVIVPVPHPYPVRVPIGKPVAVPIIHELKIPVEKPMPYLVYKDVPYPIEKPVPVPVEKEVPVPVVKPYPVHIPYIRPVFHHTKSRDEYDSDHGDDDDYMPRPNEGKNKYSSYKKKYPNGSRNRPSRRPSRTSYQDRNRRRWPERRRPAEGRDERELSSRERMRPMELHHPSPFKRRDAEPMRFQV